MRSAASNITRHDPHDFVTSPNKHFALAGHVDVSACRLVGGQMRGGEKMTPLPY
jgi:hypothetical protein